MSINLLLTKYIPSDKSAGQKAPEDIEKLFLSRYGKTYRVRYTNNIVLSYFDTLKTALEFYFIKNKSDCNLFVQWPLYVRRPLTSDLFIIQNFKRKIAIIHDLDSVRFTPNNGKAIKKEIKSLNKFDYVIAHNEKMRKWLIRNGLSTKIVTLNIFDYLLDDEITIPHSKDYKLVVAGNLNKSQYLCDIDKVLLHTINAYGPLSSYQIPKNMVYKGSFSPDELPKYIEGEFGLIWDGEETGTCSGTNGNYMRYNNPHKLSLYVACGLPIITWKQAAIADFVENNDIGFTVNGLVEVDAILDNLSYQRYQEMVSNVRKLSFDLRCGNNTICVIEKTL